MRVRILFLLLFVSPKLSFITRAKYKFHLEHIEVCPGNDKLLAPFRNLTFGAYNRTTKALNVDIYLPRPIDNTMGFKITMEIYSDGGWRKVPFLDYLPDPCKNLAVLNKSIWNLWVRMFAKAGAEHPDQCPIPAGNYPLRNLIFNEEEINLPMWSGKAKMQCMLVDAKSKEAIMCIQWYVAITEIPSVKRTNRN